MEEVMIRILSILLVLLSPLQAATFTVRHDMGSGPGSFIQVVIDAHAVPLAEPAEIIFESE